MGQCLNFRSKPEKLADPTSRGTSTPAEIESSRDFEPSDMEQIDWEDLTIATTKRKHAVLGAGSYGTVILSYFSPNKQKLMRMKVAVKIFVKSVGDSNSQDTYDKICKNVMDEVKLMTQAENRMIYKDCIVHTYGIANGILPIEYCNLLGIPVGEEAIGIVMRYEKGGSLESLIHGNGYNKPQLTIVDKIYLLFQIARSIAELHTVGIVHGDIKPENILLDENWPPNIRLSDFGFSSLIKHNTNTNQILQSTLSKTSVFRGTPLYAAPEMLMNPYQPSSDGKYAKPSRKTDIYAFALLTWEVLTQQELYPDIDTEIVLCSRIHQGSRPSLKEIPSECPMELLYMLTACWDTQRSKRKSAMECVILLHNIYLTMTNIPPDIVLNRYDYPSDIMNHIYYHFIRHGLKVAYDTTIPTPLTPPTIPTTTTTSHRQRSPVNTVTSYTNHNIDINTIHVKNQFVPISDPVTSTTTNNTISPLTTDTTTTAITTTTDTSINNIESPNSLHSYSADTTITTKDNTTYTYKSHLTDSQYKLHLEKQLIGDIDYLIGKFYTPRSITHSPSSNMDPMDKSPSSKDPMDKSPSSKDPICKTPSTTSITPNTPRSSVVLFNSPHLSPNTMKHIPTKDTSNKTQDVVLVDTRQGLPVAKNKCVNDNNVTVSLNMNELSTALQEYTNDSSKYIHKEEILPNSSHVDSSNGSFTLQRAEKEFSVSNEKIDDNDMIHLIQTTKPYSYLTILEKGFQPIIDKLIQK